MEHLDRVGLGLRLDLVEGAVDNAFGNRLLALIHEVVHELRDDEVAELRIRIDFTLFGAMTTRHVLSPRSYFGRFAPYFERR